MILFCVLGIVIFGLVIFLSLDARYHWTKYSNVPNMVCGIDFFLGGGGGQQTH